MKSLYNGKECNNENVNDYNLKIKLNFFSFLLFYGCGSRVERRGEIFHSWFFVNGKICRSFRCAFWKKRRKIIFLFQSPVHLCVPCYDYRNESNKFNLHIHEFFTVQNFLNIFLFSLFFTRFATDIFNFIFISSQLLLCTSPAAKDYSVHSFFGGKRRKIKKKSELFLDCIKNNSTSMY